MNWKCKKKQKKRRERAIERNEPDENKKRVFRRFALENIEWQAMNEQQKAKYDDIII